jgi:hypothetical protein
MKKTNRRKGAGTAESIARMADNGKDVLRFFTNAGEMKKPIQRETFRASRCRTNR